MNEIGANCYSATSVRGVRENNYLRIVVTNWT